MAEDQTTDPAYLRREADALAEAVQRHEVAIDKARRDLEAAQDAHERLRQDAEDAAQAADQAEADQPRVDGDLTNGDSVDALADPATANTED